MQFPYSGRKFRKLLEWSDFTRELTLADYIGGCKANQLLCRREVEPEMLAQLNAVRDLLTTGGRTLAQGAIGWLWATGDMVVPLHANSEVGQ